MKYLKYPIRLIRPIPCLMHEARKRVVSRIVWLGRLMERHALRGGGFPRRGEVLAYRRGRAWGGESGEAARGYARPTVLGGRRLFALVFVRGAPLNPGLLFGLFFGLSGCAWPEKGDGETLSRSAPAEASEPAPVHGTLDAGSGLKDYLRLALMHNAGVKASFYRWKAALERVAQVKTLPDPHFTYGYFVEQVETRVGPQRHRMGVNQRFPWLGTLRLKGEQAAIDARAAEYRFEADRLATLFEVKKAYYELYYLKEAIQITHENIELVKHLEAVAQARFRSGNDLTGVVKAQIELGRLEEERERLESMRGVFVEQLNGALNRPAEAELPWPSVFDFPAEGAFAALENADLDLNPELSALEARIGSARKGLALARKSYWPDVTLGVDYVETGPARMPGVAGSGADPVMVMGSINLPLWWGKYRAQVNESEARLEAAVHDRLERQNRLEAELKLVAFKLRDAERKIGLFGDTLTPLATNSLEVAEQSYQTGRADFLQLMDAQQLLLDVRLSYQRAIADRAQHHAQLEMLTGRQAVLGDLLPTTN